MSHLVIVESPAKGKTIAKYLGSEYRVEASFGHIRDLPQKQMWVDIAHGFEPVYEISPDKKKRVSELKKLVKSSEKVWIATDEDREGEAIGWHLCAALGLDSSQTDRITFHEITKTAIEKAIKNPRKLDLNLVNAQQSRRILDRIVGYEVSPVLWKKVKPGLSAGRVQSVAVKILVERDREIRAFTPEESWKIEMIVTDGSMSFPIEFARLDGKKKTFKSRTDIEKFLSTLGIQLSTLSEKQDKKWYTILEGLMDREFLLSAIEKKDSTRMPWAPFTTSTLQQEASRKLGYGVKQTMDIAQRLYQDGHITYMRTDSVNLSDLALTESRKYITEAYGAEYAMPHGRKYKTKQASAQEAHEAIRPTHFDLPPDQIHLDSSELRLYTLIWNRTIASQMREAQIETTTFDFCPFGSSPKIGEAGRGVQETNTPPLTPPILGGEKMNQSWIAKGEVIRFPWFMKLYIEGTDEEIEESGSQKLPALEQGDIVRSSRLTGSQKFSLPPPRYTEASLVKKLESEGIGRPSTYAPTIQTIIDRGYVVKEEKKLLPTDIAFVVTDYLDTEFSRFMEYGFTAQIEGEFDEISEGRKDWKSMLSEFYAPFHESVERVLWVEGRFAGDRILGTDGSSGRTVLVRMSRFGPVVQIGTPEELGEEKPRYANLPAGMNMEEIDLSTALKCFSLPKSLWIHQEKEIVIGSWRFWPYVKYGEVFISIPRWEDPLSVDMDRALEIIAEKEKSDAPIAMIDGLGVTKGKGRFGPFLKWNGLYVNIPRSIDFETITPLECETLIRAKAEKEATRYILQFPEEKISVENGRYGPYIKYEKKNLYLKREGKKITDLKEIQALTIDDLKSIIREQVPGAFAEKKPVVKTKTKTKAKAKIKTKKV